MRCRDSRRAALALALSCSLAVACGGGSPGSTDLRAVGTLEEFKAVFNADAGSPRLILLVSPT
jgi:hypothetical protein